MRNSLLFGNGINRQSDKSVQWVDLLDHIKKENKFDNGNQPYTMIYERVFLERRKWFVAPDKNNAIKHKDNSIITAETILKDEIASELEEQKSNELFEDIINLGFDNYLTTNYDYAFLDAVSYVKKDLQVNNINLESIYSIRRHKVFKNREGITQFKLWNIHGELSESKSIMLGYDQYCGYISKIEQYIKGYYDFTLNKKKIVVKNMESKIESQEYDSLSWIDLFFKDNLHIMGLSLDYNEITLWWLLNKRARLIAEGAKINNTIYFYTCEDKNSDQHELLKSFNVEVVCFPINKDTSSISKAYNDSYKKIIKEIQLNSNLDIVETTPELAFSAN